MISSSLSSFSPRSPFATCLPPVLSDPGSSRIYPLSLSLSPYTFFYNSSQFPLFPSYFSSPIPLPSLILSSLSFPLSLPPPSSFLLSFHISCSVSPYPPSIFLFHIPPSFPCPPFSFPFSLLPLYPFPFLPPPFIPHSPLSFSLLLFFPSPFSRIRINQGSRHAVAEARRRGDA